ncbi:GntR family transcriptional regulator [Corynebacterium comes]|uniref:HTH-type transcriptional repressor YvoA n=1 Tax=Corynebacterium comes TaxID=2675218 RepID=A0A6B8W184_9CORY|nr:GntR family transcriptional regulator [Corynebacterium comes]QGU03380.1 HTH-type transcriptional repressor YvoA [Corynebacterium comes]
MVHMHSPSSPKQSTHVAIGEILRSRISHEKMQAGDRFPTERELAEEFGVARMTVRKALEVLQMEGVVERRRGRTGGTFLRATVPKVEMTRMEGFIPRFRDRNMEVTSLILTADRRQAPEKVTQALEIDAGEPVFYLERLRSVNNIPALIERSFFPANLVPGMLHQDLSGSIYDLLRRRWSLPPVRKWEAIEPGVTSKQEQKLLQVEEELPILRLERRTQVANNRFIEYAEDVLRTDIARVEVYTTAGSRG